MCCDALPEILGWRDGTGVVDARGFVVHGDVGGACLGDTLLQAVAAGCPSCTVLDHLHDLAGGAGVLDGAVVAGSGTIVRLHESWVADAVVGGWGADATVAFLHHDGEDEARVDAGGCADGLDGGGDFVDFGFGVLRDAELGTAG